MEVLYTIESDDGVLVTPAPNADLKDNATAVWLYHHALPALQRVSELAEGSRWRVVEIEDLSGWLQLQADAGATYVIDQLQPSTQEIHSIEERMQTACAQPAV